MLETITHLFVTVQHTMKEENANHAKRDLENSVKNATKTLAQSVRMVLSMGQDIVMMYLFLVVLFSNTITLDIA